MTEKEKQFIAGRCLFCGKDFEKERGLQVHKGQCSKNPSARQWRRSTKVKRPRGAQPWNKNAAKNYAERKGLTPPIHLLPAQHDTNSETVSNTGATPQAPKSFATNRIYDYLLAGILLSILLCGVIYAALGIKLLFEI